MNSMLQILSTLAKAARATAMAFAVAMVFATQVHAATDIAFFNLDGLSITANSLPGAGGAPNLFSATSGSGTLYLSPDHTGVAGTGVKGAVDDAAGSALNNPVVNAITTTGATALLLQNGVTGNVLVGNGQYVEIEFPMSGESNIGVSYATYASSAAAFNSNQWSYSTNGTTFTNFESPVTSTGAIGPNHITTGGYSLVGPLIATGLNGYSGTAYLRYTYSGATGTAATPSNRLDNVRVQSAATAAPASNAASLPLGGDIVFGLNNVDPTNTLELVRGSASPGGGVRYPGPWQTTGFIEAVKFDNYGTVAHNAQGNLLGVNFGASATGGEIYSMATTGTNPAPTGQLIGNTKLAAATAIGQSGAGGCGTGNLCLTGVTLSRLAGLSVAPDNSKIAVVGTDTGRVLVYKYTAGNTAGAGASLADGRESVNVLSNSTQGTAWKDNNTVLAFSVPGNLVSVDATTMVTTDIGVVASGTATDAGPLGVPFTSSPYTSIAYNPGISPYVYALWSGFAAAATPQSQTRLYVFDPSNNYSLLTTQTDGNGLKGIDLSQSTQTGRDIALDKNGNLFIGAFDSTITYMPAADFLNPAAIAAIPSGVAGISTFYYQSTYNATAFPGMDIGFAAPGITGDYNNDGKVDAGDYVTWKKAVGTTNVLANDPVGGTIGTAQYNNWRANFGKPPGAGSGFDGTAVPEPAGAILLMIGLAAFCSRRVVRRRSCVGFC